MIPPRVLFLNSGMTVRGFCWMEGERGGELEVSMSVSADGGAMALSLG